MKKSVLLRSLLILLAALLLLGTVACGNTPNSGSTSTTASKNAEATTADINDPHIAAEDWENEQFNILYNGSDLEPNLDFSATETNGAVLNDAVYNRNLYIQEKYHLVINAEYKSDSKIASTVETATASGDMAYHLTEANQTYSMSMGLKGYLYDLESLPNVDTSKPYWFSSALPGSSIGGFNYFAYSDANVHAFGATPCVIFNKTVHARFTNLEDIYTLVNEKKWTYEAMSSMVKVVTSDLDGIDGIGEKDQLGLIANTFCVDCLISGSGFQTIVKDENDLPVVNFNNEQFINIIEGIQKLCSAENGMLLCDRFGTSTEIRDYWPERAISENRALFWIGNFKCVERLRASEAEFGIVPIPMANLEQKEYKIHMQANIGAAMSVPTCLQEEDLERVSAVLEDIAYQSYLHVMPAYFEVLIQGQSVRDVESLDMIKIIRNAYYCDLGFMLGDYGIKILSSMRSVVKDNTAVASKLESEARTYAGYIKRINAIFGSEG